VDTESRYIVIFWDWPVKGSKRIKSFDDLQSAELYTQKILSIYEDASDQIMIVYGKILKLGAY
jgi:hypothetical protein